MIEEQLSAVQWPHWFKVPQTKQEAIDRIMECKTKQLEIQSQLLDTARAQKMNGRDFMVWRNNAQRARAYTLNEQNWLRRWITLYDAERVNAPDSKAARREAHLLRQQARLAAIDASGGVPEIVRLLRVKFVNLMNKHGEIYDDDTERLLDMAQAYVDAEDPQD